MDDNPQRKEWKDQTTWNLPTISMMPLRVPSNVEEYQLLPQANKLAEYCNKVIMLERDIFGTIAGKVHVK